MSKPTAKPSHAASDRERRRAYYDAKSASTAALDRLETSNPKYDTVSEYLYFQSERKHFIRECIHWIFHLIMIIALVVIMYQFLQFDTYYYEQDGEGQNVIQHDIRGDANVTEGESKTQKAAD